MLCCVLFCFGLGNIFVRFVNGLGSSLSFLLPFVLFVVLFCWLVLVLWCFWFGLFR